MADDVSDTDILRRPVGRPSKYEPAIVDVLLQNIAEGLPLKACAVYAGVDYTTYLDWIERFPEFSNRVIEARRKRLVNLTRRANKISRTDAKAVFRLMELADPDNFAPLPTKVEHSNSPQNVDIHVSISTASTEAMARLQGMMQALLPEPSIDGEFSEVDDTGD